MKWKFRQRTKEIESNHTQTKPNDAHYTFNREENDRTQASQEQSRKIKRSCFLFNRSILIERMFMELPHAQHKVRFQMETVIKNNRKTEHSFLLFWWASCNSKS